MGSGKTDREQRLAEALRANLRRRKGQAREWASDDGAPEPSVPSVPPVAGESPRPGDGASEPDE